MDVVVGTSWVLAVLLNETERVHALRLTEDANAVAPTSLLFEVANAISSLVKRQHANSIWATELWRQWRSITVQLHEIDLGIAVELAARRGI